MLTLGRNCLHAWLLAALVGSGCNLRHWRCNDFKVGPNYRRPAAPVASEWIDYQDPRVKSDEVDLSQWWRTFNDPTLDSLLDTAYRQNLSLRVAGGRILEARAVRGIAAGNLLPQLQEAFGGYTRNKVSDSRVVRPPELWFSDWETGLNVSWELDFWGRFRRAVASADAELDASIENYDDVLVVLLAEVSSSYVEYRTFQERLVYARQNVDIQTRSYQLAQDKLDAGAATERDAQQARQVLEQTRALIPLIEIGMRQANNSLCVLLGIPPRDLSDMLDASSEIPTAPDEVVLGIPADLVRRRPDVRRAEREVAAQSERIGIAIAEFYPHLFIDGTIGLGAEHFSDLFDAPGSVVAGVGPGFRWNILNYGRIQNNVRVQDARFQQLAYTYQDAVLRAGREAEDALVGFLKSQERADYLAQSVGAAQRAVEISFDQYRLGAIDFTPVFLFQETLADQQDQYASAQGEIAVNLIRLYRALGGGWQIRLAGDSGEMAFIPAEESAAPPSDEQAPLPPVDEPAMEPLP